MRDVIAHIRKMAMDVVDEDPILAYELDDLADNIAISAMSKSDKKDVAKGAGAGAAAAVGGRAAVKGAKAANTYRKMDKASRVMARNAVKDRVKAAPKAAWEATRGAAKAAPGKIKGAPRAAYNAAKSHPKTSLAVGGAAAGAGAVAGYKKYKKMKKA